MSYLSGDKQAEMLAKLRGQEAPSEPSEIEHNVVEQTASPKEEPKPDVEVSSTREEEGHAVPYQRFKQIIGAKNQLQEEKERLAKELEELRAQLENNSVVREEESSVYEDEDSGYETEEDQRWAQLDTRMREFEIAREEQLLERELEQVSSQYPQVPREALLQAVIQDPSTNLMELAGAYATHLASVEEAAIARYVQENNIAVPKRGSQSGAGGGKVEPSHMTNGTGTKPKTISEATSRFKEFLLKNRL